MNKGIRKLLLAGVAVPGLVLALSSSTPPPGVL